MCICLSVYQYKLETFTESRSTMYKVVGAYHGEPVDGLDMGTPPNVWDIQCEPEALFQDQVKKIKVPHSEILKVIGECWGSLVSSCLVCCLDLFLLSFEIASTQTPVRSDYLHETIQSRHNTELQRTDPGT